MRLHHPTLALVESARLLENLERNSCLADIVEQRGLSEGRRRCLIEAKLPTDEEAQRRNVDRVAIRQVLVELDRENLTEGGVTGSNLLNQQVDDVANRGEVDPLARHHVVKRALGQRKRELVGGIERAARRVGPLDGLPACVERDQVPQADVLDLPRRELDVDGLAGRRLLQLPEKLGERQ